MNRCVITLQASRDLDEISEYFVSRNREHPSYATSTIVR
jgi:hypothetical protein